MSNFPCRCLQSYSPCASTTMLAATAQAALGPSAISTEVGGRSTQTAVNPATPILVPIHDPTPVIAPATTATPHPTPSHSSSAIVNTAGETGSKSVIALLPVLIGAHHAGTACQPHCRRPHRGRRRSRLPLSADRSSPTTHQSSCRRMTAPESLPILTHTPQRHRHRRRWLPRSRLRHRRWQPPSRLCRRRPRSRHRQRRQRRMSLVLLALGLQRGWSSHVSRRWHVSSTWLKGSR